MPCPLRSPHVQRLIKETAAVAAVSVAADAVVKVGKRLLVQALPGGKCPLSPMVCYIVEVAAAGAVYHLISEAIGMDDWMLRNAAAAAAAVADAQGIWAVTTQTLTPPRRPLPCPGQCSAS